jgi:hypothetical protein
MMLTGFQRCRPLGPAWRLFVLGSVLAVVSAAEAADRIILRSLKIISDRTVQDFDVDGVRLDDGSTLGWDEIERATLRPDRQAEFDQLLADLGNPLYRIRQRLSVGDYEGILPHAKAVAPRLAGRSSNTAYMVQQALMWAHLADGKREAALAPYLRCYEYLRHHPDGARELPGERRLQYDARTGLSSELPAVWFDASAARAAMPNVYETIRSMQRPLPAGVYIYYGSLALAAGDEASATRILGAVRSEDRRLRELHEVLTAQRELSAGRTQDAVQRLDQCLAGSSAENRPLVLYWAGYAKTHLEDVKIQQQGLLDLLRIPALFGRGQPELAGAALYRAHQVLAQMNDPRGSVSLRKELLERYGQTYFAARARSPARPSNDPEEAP